jgi:hypothetical protein
MDGESKKALGMGVGAAVGISSSVGVLWGIEPEIVKQFLSETAQSQIAQAGFFFTLAAWIHAGRVKKEIGKHFISLTTAIDGVSRALRADLAGQKEILENHAIRLENLEKIKS